MGADRMQCMFATLLAGLVAFSQGAYAQTPAPPPRPQNPSPMVEHTRTHQRIPEGVLPGTRWSIDDVLPRSVRVFVPDHREGRSPQRLLIHFHGADYIPEHAAAEAAYGVVVAIVHLGAGSGVYERAFADPAVFDRLLATLRARLGRELLGAEFSTVELSGFSAGYGAIRAILQVPRHFAIIKGVLLLDGLHTDYDPPRIVVADGGTLDAIRLAPFVQMAEAAARGEKRFLITHSEIFPGTFASTTETTDHLVRELGIQRTPVLEWGPLGMQQLSNVQRGRFRILGFAGNSAPDHVDHFHGMFHFLQVLQAL